MATVRQIIENNNATFYDYQSGKRTSLFPRLLSFVCLSVFLGLIVGDPKAELASAVITVQAILVGFGFSVLFFLASSERETIGANASLEKKERLKRLHTLSDELFFNVSYYNVITVLSILLALILLLAPISSGAALSGMLGAFQDLIGDHADYIIKIGTFGWWTFLFTFYFVFCESIYTFHRIVVRVNFYFTQKRALRE